MTGLKFINLNDSLNRWSLEKVCEITGLIKEPHSCLSPISAATTSVQATPSVMPSSWTTVR